MTRHTVRPIPNVRALDGLRLIEHVSPWICATCLLPVTSPAYAPSRHVAGPGRNETETVSPGPSRAY